MRQMYLASVLFMSSTVFAAGNGGHGHVTDLIAPLVNVLVLFGFLAWKLKKPLSDYFTNQAETITNTLERASLKSKEAEVMLQAQQKKMQTLEAETKEIMRQADQDMKAYEINSQRELEERSTKLKTDASSKIEAERKSMVANLNAALLDEVIAKAKSTIRTNSEYQNKASAKMLGEMAK